MNFSKVIIFIALALIALSVPTEAGRWKKFWKKVERVGQHTRDAANQVLDIGIKAGSVATVLG